MCASFESTFAQSLTGGTYADLKLARHKLRLGFQYSLIQVRFNRFLLDESTNIELMQQGSMLIT